MGSGENRHLEQIDIWGKGYSKWPKSVPQVPCAQSPKIFANGHRGKWTLGANGQLSKGVTQEPISPKWALGQNGHWGKWALGAPSYVPSKLRGCAAVQLTENPRAQRWS